MISSPFPPRGCCFSSGRPFSPPSVFLKWFVRVGHSGLFFVSFGKPPIGSERGSGVQYFSPGFPWQNQSGLWTLIPDIDCGVKSLPPPRHLFRFPHKNLLCFFVPLRMIDTPRFLRVPSPPLFFLQSFFFSP